MERANLLFCLQHSLLAKILQQSVLEFFDVVIWWLLHILRTAGN